MENNLHVSKEDMNTVEPSAPMQHYPRKHGGDKRKKKLLIIACVAAGVVVVAALVGFFVMKKPTSQTNQPADNTSQTPPAEDLPAPTPADSTPVAYKNAKLSLELTHRKDWMLTESEDGTEVILTSPRITYTKAGGEAGTGVFTIKIRKGAAEPMKATIEKSVAARDSEVIGYATPSETQRHFTNVSYAGTNKGEDFNFFIVTGSTEIKAGKPFAHMLAFDSDAYLFVGGYGEDKDNSLTFDAVPKAQIDSPAKEQAIDIIESIKLL